MLTLIFTTRFWKWIQCWLMSKNVIKYRPAKYLFGVSLISLLFFACAKDTGIGSNVLPSSDILSAYVTDTTTVLSSIKILDSANTYGAPYVLLGSYFDPVFGVTKSSFYTQVIGPGGIAAFNPCTYLDSVVLVLPINTNGLGMYGTLTPQTFTVDTLTDQGAFIPSKTIYYSDTNLAHGTHHIGVATISPNPDASILENIDYGSSSMITMGPQVRIKLNNSFGSYIMNQVNNNPSYQTYQANFSTLLKGLYVSVSNSGQLPGQGSIYYINPNTPGAGVWFYYRYVNGTTFDTTAQNFVISGPYFNHFEHDYSTTPFYSVKDSVLSPNVCYVQAMGGVKTQLSFPFLSNWKNLGPIIINAAQVIIPVNVNATGSDSPPTAGLLQGDSAGHPITIADEYNSATYGGDYDAFNRQYVFNIARYIQQVIDGKIIDRGLYFSAAYSSYSANGAVLYGAAKNGSSPRIRLKIFYTPVKH